MEGSGTGGRLAGLRRSRMWTQARLAAEAGVSPTTVSGIESGKISRPHFGTLGKLARSLGVDPRELVAPPASAAEEDAAPMSLEWARSSPETEFERGLEGASLSRLESLSSELDEERGRLQALYGEFPRGSEQRRFIKRQIRDVSAQSGSVSTSIMFHQNARQNVPTDAGRAGESAGPEPGEPEPDGSERP
jgi:transcriptional regulator with XRE-family HTH domain